MTAHDPRVTLTEVLAAHVRLPMMHSQGCSCGWHASLSYPDLHRAHLAERIEEIIAARLAAVRALAEAWDHESPSCEPTWGDCCHVGQLRAALDAPVSASQDHDGTHGPPETNRPSDHQQRLRATFLAAALEGEVAPPPRTTTGPRGRGEGERAGEGCEYVPKSRWTGLPNYPRWAACRCGWESDVQRTTWREASEDYREHTERATR